MGYSPDDELHPYLGGKRARGINKARRPWALREGIRQRLPRKGVRVSHLAQFRCGNVNHAVRVYFLLKDTTSPKPAERKFRMAALVHQGVLLQTSNRTSAPCSICRDIFRLIELYETRWRRGIILKPEERVWTMDPQRQTNGTIAIITEVVDRWYSQLIHDRLLREKKR